MALKTYVLLDYLDANVPIYTRTNATTRVPIKKRPVDHLYLVVTFADEKGKNHRHRLKLQTDEIDYQIQIKELGIPANEGFTNAERDAVKFTNGVLMTNNETVQKFIEQGPQIEGFKGFCEGVRPICKVYDASIEVKSTNEDFKKRLKVANMIAEMEDVKEAQDLMIRLNGTYFTPPATLEECQNALVEYMDEADDEGLERMMKKKLSLDEEVIIVISRAVHAGIISFDAVKDQISRKKGNGWASVKIIPSDMSKEDREMFFLNYLTSEDGKLLLNDLKRVTATEKKGSKVKEAVA